MSRKPQMSGVREVLERAMAGAFAGKGWQGPALLGSVRGVSAAEARARPGGLKHGVWDYVLHAAYWKYVVCLKLGAAERDSFPRSPSNWPALPEAASAAADEKAWRADVRLLKSYHERLVEAVAGMDLSRMNEIPAGGKSVRVLDVLVGIAAHDAYHTGQIQVVKRLVGRK
ncbi:MAG: DinB family protein [Phycisphaerales bacterium]|nr:DinB family protein [Phycisphaerales bacterium]